MARPRAAAHARTSPGTAEIDLSDVPGDLRRAVGAALHAAGVSDGHIGVEIVGEGRMRTLNYAARGVDEATDVLAFPIDDQPEGAGPRELGDVFICPEKASDVTQPVCPVSVRTFRPVATSQTRIVLSLLPVANQCLSALKAVAYTPLE